MNPRFPWRSAAMVGGEKRWPRTPWPKKWWMAWVALALVSGSGMLHAAEPKIDPRDRAKVAQGEKLYARHCASCHGKNLEGEANWRKPKPNGRMPAPPHDATGHTWHHPDAVLFAITRDGLVPGKTAPPGYASDMPAFRGVLSDSEIAAVLSYIQSRWPPEVWAVRREMLNNLRR